MSAPDRVGPPPGGILIPADVADWIARGERGISSETIVAHLTGLRLCRRLGVPRDPDDLRRCILLLDACPSLDIAGMATCDGWNGFAREWPDLVATFDAETQWRTGRPRWNAPKTFEMMKRLRGLS